MNEPRKSDSLVVPMKAPNKAGQPAAEAVEGRGLAKGNPPSKTRPGLSAGTARPERWSEYVRRPGRCAASRHHLRQEPDAVIPHVRIRGGGHG